MEKLIGEEKINQNINGCNGESAHNFDNNDISACNTSSQKSFSPTLIEHALKVVKNIFSPDKNKSMFTTVFTCFISIHSVTVYFLFKSKAL